MNPQHIRLFIGCFFILASDWLLSIIQNFGCKVKTDENSQLDSNSWIQKKGVDIVLDKTLNISLIWLGLERYLAKMIIRFSTLAINLNEINIINEDVDYVGERASKTADQIRAVRDLAAARHCHGLRFGWYSHVQTCCNTSITRLSEVWI